MTSNTTSTDTTTSTTTGTTTSTTTVGCGSSLDERCVDPRVVRSRRAVLAAATELLVEAGPRGVTVDAVAARSGVAKSTMYRHWPSRTALLIDVMSSNMPEIPPPPSELGFETALRQLVSDVATMLASPEWLALLPALMSLKQHLPEIRDLSDADEEHRVDVLADVIASGVAEGALPAGLDAWTVATVLFGPVVFTLLSGRLDRVRDVADFAVDRFLASYRT